MVFRESEMALIEFSKDGDATAAAGTGQVTSFLSDQRLRDLLIFARSKLLCKENVFLSLWQYSKEARTAVLDTRIILTYEVSRFSVRAHETNLVTSHMRTVYSISRHLAYLRSGYSSEPILAEAAARQLYNWRRDQLQQYSTVEPAVTILRESYRDGLLAHSEIRDTVGRLLLVLAHDHAATNNGGVFSAHISVEAFFKALLPEEAADKLLDSVPDNGINAQGMATTLREAYKDAVLNFTHFAQWEDDSTMIEDIALGCFIRHMALACRSNTAIVDVFIPVLMDSNANLEPSVMSGLFVQFHLRQQAGSLSAYTINEEEMKFFSRRGPRSRPYISLIMELGVTSPPPLLAQMYANYWPKTAKEDQKTNAEPDDSPIAQGSPTESQMNIPPAAPSRRRQTAVHPRYSMYIHGCSPSVYKVISKDDHSLYKILIGSGEPLSEHPRQNAESLDQVRNLKPFFAEGHPFWHWKRRDALSVDDPVQESEDADVDGGIFFRIPAGDSSHLNPIRQ